MAVSPVEIELGEIGRSLAAAFPSPALHPVKTLDARAMERSMQDAELRAALFRLVDVTPATRSLDDLARHLSAYLEDVEERPQPLRVAMRMAENAAGRRALGVAAAASVRHMARRFIVAESPRAARRLLASLQTAQPPRDRETEAAKARARSAARYAA
jgi:RHH-type proline utilization regulon transcriptional repressor/proline dehydrogenase/delta 1-pyrroline-5-carboxylate dehydrogenase